MARTRPMLNVFLTVSKILVVDDSKMMRRYLRERIEEAGYEVEEWLPLSAMEIPEHLIASAPDLILSDYQMPGCNGATLARMAQRANPKTPLIVLTAFRDKEMESNLLRLGVRQVLSKPIRPRDLIQAIEDALSAHATES
jgi:CheY-like chemotaxis protein